MTGSARLRDQWHRQQPEPAIRRNCGPQPLQASIQNGSAIHTRPTPPRPMRAAPRVCRSPLFAGQAVQRHHVPWPEKPMRPIQGVAQIQPANRGNKQTGHAACRGAGFPALKTGMPCACCVGACPVAQPCPPEQPPNYSMWLSAILYCGQSRQTAHRLCLPATMCTPGLQDVLVFDWPQASSTTCECVEGPLRTNGREPETARKASRWHRVSESDRPAHSIPTTPHGNWHHQNRRR